jgi:hypothetical protein
MSGLVPASPDKIVNVEVDSHKGGQMERQQIGELIYGDPKQRRRFTTAATIV